MNMPLAISRARIFYSERPKAHLSYMDFIQIAVRGSAGRHRQVRAAIQQGLPQLRHRPHDRQLHRELQRDLIHFFPVDKRKIYRANKLVGRQVEAVDYDKLAAGVNKNKDGETVEVAHRTNAAEIANLMAASSTVSTDATPGTTRTTTPCPRTMDRYAAPTDTQPDVIYERWTTGARWPGPC
jgi:hypothetical protein